MTLSDPTQVFRLDGKVVIVTGASSGLGERFARVADAAGARVVLTARREEKLIEQQGANDLRQAQEKAAALRIDAEGNADRTRMANEAKAEGIRLVEEAKVVAMVSIGDVVKVIMQQQAMMIEQLESYIDRR